MGARPRVRGDVPRVGAIQSEVRSSFCSAFARSVSGSHKRPSSISPFRRDQMWNFGTDIRACTCGDWGGRLVRNRNHIVVERPVKHAKQRADDRIGVLLHLLEGRYRTVHVCLLGVTTTRRQEHPRPI